MSEAQQSNRVPFAWQDKRVLRRIRESFDDRNVVSSALGTYLALTCVASDKAADEFTTTQDWLATLCGLSARTIRSRLHDLARIKVVDISTPALRAPSSYRLLPFGNGCPTSGNGCRAFGKREGSTVAAIRTKNRDIPPGADAPTPTVPQPVASSRNPKRGPFKKAFYEAFEKA